MSEIKVGDRVQDLADGQRATVKYVGPVPPTKGVWLGVDWDAGDQRGKHDGSHEGQTFFKASTSKSGSFVRSHKVRGGVTLNEAMKDKYGVDVCASINEGMVDDLRREIKASFIQMVGFEEISKEQADFKKLRTVDLSNSMLKSLDPEQEHPLEKVTELNLAENLIADWKTVADICQSLRYLRSLTVNGNRLTLGPEVDQILARTLPKVEELIMAEMSYTWSECLTIGQSFPALKTLQVPINRITVIQSFGDVFENLVGLNLSANPISDWGSVMHFSGLPHLKTLILTECPFTEISIPADGTHFKALELLHICRIQLSHWRSVSALESMPKLKEIRMNGCSLLTTETPETARQLVIARIAQLAKLNGAEIEDQERRGAEIDYLKKYGLEFLDSKEDVQKKMGFEADHPSYNRLSIKHDWNPSLEELKPKDTRLAAGLLTLYIQCPNEPDFKIVTKKIPPKMLISKVKLLLQRVVKKRPQDMQLSYVAKDKEQEYQLDSDMRDLFFYDVESEGTILVR